MLNKGNIFIYAQLVLAAIIIGCGGGGSSTPPPPPPSVQTSPAEVITSHSAALKGLINPHGSAEYYIEYSGDPSFSYHRSLIGGSISGTSNQTLSLTLSSLAAGTTYYFRVYAFNAGGGVYGSILSFTTASAAEAYWAKTYGGTGDYNRNDLSSSIKATSDGGFVAAGLTSSLVSRSGDFWVVKTDSNGAVQWQKAYGGPGWDTAYDIVQTTDGGYAVAGGYDVSTNTSVILANVWVIRLNGDGTIRWQKSFCPGSAKSIQQTADGGFIVAALTSAFGAGGEDILVLKLDSDGSIQWQKTFGSTGQEEAASVALSGDGGYVIAGWSSSFSGNTEAWLLKLNGSGSVVWQKTYSALNFARANAVQRTADGGYVFAGYADTGGLVLLLTKIAGDGTLQWWKFIDNSDALSVVQTSDGGYAVAGYTGDAITPQGLIVKFGNDGSLVWQKTFGWRRSFASIGELPSGDLFAAGHYDISYQDLDFQIIKTPGSGALSPLSADAALAERAAALTERDTTIAGVDAAAAQVDTSVTPIDTRSTILQQAP